MFFFPWSAIAWLEFWAAMNRAWLHPDTNVPADPRVVPFPIARVRAGAGRRDAAPVVRLSV